MAKLSIKVEQRTFDIDLKDDIHQLLVEKIGQDLDLKESNSIADLLKAYLNECYKSVAKEQKIETIIKKLEEH
jgi:hypothetical protein